MDAQKQTQKATITGLILTCNGERLLPQCLASLAFCDKLLLVDSGSTDATEQLAKDVQARFIFNPWTGFADQFTFAAKHIDTDWFFILDQDEICDATLATQIQEAIQGPQGQDSTLSAFSTNRVSWYFDRFLRHSGWYPDRIPRVFKRDEVTFSQDAHIHYHPKGRTETLQSGHIIHYPYTGFDNHWTKMGVYAQQGADHMRAKGKKPSLLKAVLHAHWKFIRIYVLKQGFRDGKAGFITACFASFYTFSRYVRVFDASWGAPYTDRPAFLDEETKKS
ncbi:MAG: glycosyltransferase family 2 protein [Pseudomonadota bacterium]